MSSKQSTVDFLVEQISEAGIVTSRKMFGEYALYCEGRVVALVCDDQLFVKPTEAGRAFLKSPVEKPPYPGAKPYFWIADEYWDDSEFLTELIKVTTQEVPLPKPKKKKLLA
ncbi:MAG TPA: TfoX/Sxy family protein [Vitreimonas sp.]|nr:TfoX/Sxy family protein [Vitreimonas sp.]